MYLLILINYYNYVNYICIKISNLLGFKIQLKSGSNMFRYNKLLLVVK